MEIDVEPYTIEEEAAEALTAELTALPGVRERLPGAGLRIADFRLLDRDGGEDGGFAAVVHDPESYRSARVIGRLGALGDAEVRAVRYRPLPDREEFARAVAAVRADPELGLVLAREGAHAYRPMPPPADIEKADGTSERVVTVGVRDPDGEIKHRIVGVRSRDGAVITAPAGVVASARHDCETTPGVDDCPATPGHRAVRVRYGASVVWDLVVVRPEYSSGTNGSGAELRFVDHRGDAGALPGAPADPQRPVRQGRGGHRLRADVPRLAEPGGLLHRRGQRSGRPRLPAVLLPAPRRRGDPPPVRLRRGDQPLHLQGAHPPRLLARRRSSATPAPVSPSIC